MQRALISPEWDRNCFFQRVHEARSSRAGCVSPWEPAPGWRAGCAWPRLEPAVVTNGAVALTQAVAIAAPASGGAAKPIPGMLLGVDGASARDVWAVGTSPAGTVAERWNGSGWKKMPTPSPGSSRSHDDVLEAVAAVADQCLGCRVLHLRRPA